MSMAVYHPQYLIMLGCVKLSKLKKRKHTFVTSIAEETVHQLEAILDEVGNSIIEKYKQIMSL